MDAAMPPTILALHDKLIQGQTSSVALTEAALARIDDADGEGAKAFTRVYRDQALASARASDLLRAVGPARSPPDGLPISIQDTFDVAGGTTLAGSNVLEGGAPARETSPNPQQAEVGTKEEVR